MRASLRSQVSHSPMERCDAAQAGWTLVVTLPSKTGRGRIRLLSRSYSPQAEVARTPLQRSGSVEASGYLPILMAAPPFGSDLELVNSGFRFGHDLVVDRDEPHRPRKHLGLVEIAPRREGCLALEFLTGLESPGLSGLGVAGGFLLEAPKGDRLVRGGTAGLVAAADRHAHGTHANRDDE